jgi:hypothetical protein
LLLASCKVDARVEVTVRDDGSGTVAATLELDADAVRRLGGAEHFAETVPLDDLRAAGWEITDLVPGDGGSAAATFTHGFVDQADLAVRLEELAGPNGVLREPRIAREREWFSTRDALSMVVDLRSPTVPIVEDEELAKRLRGVGLEPEALQAELSRQLKEALGVTVVVHLPDGTSRTFEAPPDEVSTFDASHRAREWDRLVQLGIGATLLLIATAFGLAARVSSRRDRRRRGERRPRIEVERAPLM